MTNSENTQDPNQDITQFDVVDEVNYVDDPGTDDYIFNEPDIYSYNIRLTLPVETGIIVVCKYCGNFKRVLIKKEKTWKSKI